jgi:hypothetical protein
MSDVVVEEEKKKQMGKRRETLFVSKRFAVK